MVEHVNENPHTEGNMMGTYDSRKTYLESIIRDFTAESDSLTGEDLSGFNLSGASLAGMDLTGTNLSGANMEGADLSYATLSGVIIDKHTNMRNVNMEGVDATGVDFVCPTDGARVCDANMKGAMMTRVQFNGLANKGRDAANWPNVLLVGVNR